MTTGPGRPVAAISKAVRMVASSRSGFVTRNTCLATEPMMAEIGRLLERVRADHGRRHLAADDHDGHGVGHGVPHRRDGVGGAGAGGDHADADAAAGPGITCRHEARALLVGGHDQGDRRVAGLVPVLVVVAEHRVVGGQDGAAAVAEDRLHALVGEDLHDHLGAGHALAGERVGRCFDGLGAGCHGFRDMQGGFPRVSTNYSRIAIEFELGEYSRSHASHHFHPAAERGRRPGAGRLPVRHPGLQHRVPERGPDRRPPGFPAHAGHHRVGRDHRPDQQAAAQAGRRGQYRGHDPRRPHRAGAAAAEAPDSRGRPRAHPGARRSRKAPGSSTTRSRATPLELTGAANRIDTFINRAASHADILAVVRSGPLAVARGVPVLAATT